MIYKVHYNIDS